MAYTPPPTSAAGAVSLGLGASALLIAWMPGVGIIGIVLAVLGLTSALRARRLLRLGYVVDGGLATAGLVTSAAALVFGMLVHVIIVAAVLAA